jgi:hypothetical protein
VRRGVLPKESGVGANRAQHPLVCPQAVVRQPLSPDSRCRLLVGESPTVVTANLSVGRRSRSRLPAVTRYLLTKRVTPMRQGKIRCTCPRWIEYLCQRSGYCGFNSRLPPLWPQPGRPNCSLPRFGHRGERPGLGVCTDCSRRNDPGRRM